MRNLWAKIADYIRETDKILLVLVFLTTSFGCIAVYSATSYMDNIRPFIIQTLSMFLGIGAAIFISCFDYEKYLKKWYIFLGGAVLLVALTFFIGVAPEGTDDKAWLDLGFTTLQPAELLKIAFVLSFSFHLRKIKPNINKLKYLIPICIHGAAPIVLIHFQGDDGTALVFAVMVISMMWAAGVSWKYFLLAFTTALCASPLVYFFIMNEDQRERIISIFNIEADIQGIGYQQWCGRLALAGGGTFGQGYLNGEMTQGGLVPESHNDFIFVTIGEELGFLGCITVLILLGAICLRIIRVARICTNDAGKFICVGIFAMLFAQTVINIGMCTSVLPVIGVTLPFFSSGGSSLVCLYLGIGLAISVFKYRNSRTIYLHD